MIKAICILVDNKGNTIGARFENNGNIIDLSTDSLKRYSGKKIQNAIIDKNGIVRAKRGNLEKIVKEHIGDTLIPEKINADIKCINDIKYREAIELGVDTSNIAVCKKLRRLAKCDRIRLDETEHRSGLNKHLFDYIKYCGVDVLQFIKQYMSNLQPYMIERRKDQEKVKSFICVIDNAYRVSVYIKVDSKQFEEAVVSFHEDNKRGIAKTNSLIKVDDRPVAVLADCILSKISSENKYVVKVMAQRGMKELPIEVAAIKSDDIFVVRRRAIETQFIEYCNQYIRDLYTSDLDIDFNKVEVFSMLQQISFTSYGRDTFSSISLLIDSICVQKDYVSKTTADSALVTFVQNLKLTSEQKEEIITLLEQKFRVTSIKGIDSIINRVKDNISIGYIEN